MSNKIPTEYREAVNQLKHDLVEEVFAQAEALQQDLIKFKQTCREEIKSYLHILAEEYHAPKEDKGNLTLTNMDKTKKVQISISDIEQFDEKLQIAKSLIDKCIAKWIGGSCDEIKTLVNFAFEVDKKGKVSTARVLELKRLNIQDPDWQNAMQAISDSKQVVKRKSYLNLHERKDKNEDWEHLSLNLAKIKEKEISNVN